MSWIDPFKRLLRQRRFETLEERLALSAQPLADLAVEPLALPQAPSDYGEIAPALADPNGTAAVRYAHDEFGLTGAGQTIAVIDTGIAYDHTALGGGFGEDYRVIGGWDFAENDADPYDDGPFGFHGTHVAGILGSDQATHPGVAPGADLVALRVFDDLGRSDLGWVESALRWVHRNRAQYHITTVDLSLGTGWNSDGVPAWATLEDELRQLRDDGLFLSVAAGNAFDRYHAPGLSYPAASPYVVPVASYGPDGSISSFSQRSDRVLVAPGEQIPSTIPSHLFGGTGPSSYFMAASGTSMAAPYVAGASVILREAMQIAGYQQIDQDALYDYFRSTADMIYDSATGTSYHRVDLQNALDTLLADEYGSTAADAYALGTLAGGETFSGMIGRLDDQDVFTFTAARSGEIRFSAAATHELVAHWQLVGGEAVADGEALSFTVQAGQTYTVALGSSGGLGRYDVSVQLEAAAPIVPVDWGIVSSDRFDGQRLTGEAWYQLAAARDGILSVESFFRHADGNIDLEIYDAGHQRIASSSSTADYERLDVEASAGDTFLLRVGGANPDVDLRLTNLVQLRDGRLDVWGTASDDTFRFAAGAVEQVVVNGTEYQLDSSATHTVAFHGHAGTDTITLTGTRGRDTATLRVGAVQLTGSGYQVQADSVENVLVEGGGGRDRATFYDSAGDDRLIARPASVTLRGDGFSHTARGFASVYAYAAAGGNDRADMYDSAQADFFYARPEWSVLRGRGFFNYVEGFDTVSAYSRAGGYDRAWLRDGAGNDRLEARPDYVVLAGAGFANRAEGFARVSAYATGGRDIAHMYDSPGNDHYTARPTYNLLRGAGYYNFARGFDRVYAYATAGGNDSAKLFDSRANDRFYARPAYSVLSGVGFYNYVRGFDTVDAYAHAGGTDRAYLYGSAGSDLVTAGPAGIQMRGRGFANAAHGFEMVRAHSLAGVDQAVFADGEPGANPVQAGRAAGDQPRALNLVVYGFEHIQARSEDGRAASTDVQAVDHLFYQLGGHSAVRATGARSP